MGMVKLAAKVAERVAGDNRNIRRSQFYALIMRSRIEAVGCRIRRRAGLHLGLGQRFGRLKMRPQLSPLLEGERAMSP